MEVPYAEPAWEGGPLLAVPFMMPMLRTVGWVFHLQPCGHEVPREAVTATQRA